MTLTTTDLYWIIPAIITTIFVLSFTAVYIGARQHREEQNEIDFLKGDSPAQKDWEYCKIHDVHYEYGNICPECKSEKNDEV